MTKVPEPWEKERPARLYRYITLANATQRARARETLQESKLWYTTAAKLNDPFELRFDVAFEFSTGDLRKELSDPELRAALQVPDGIPRTSEDAAAIIASLRAAEAGIPGRFRDALMSRCAICCFSARNDELLLWSYYADGHRGMCLEFTNTGPESICALAHPITYQTSYPSFCYPRDPWERVAAQVFLTKASAWAHEQEWRLIATNETEGYRSFQPHELTGVICGCEMTDVVRDEFCELLATTQPHVQVYQAERRPSQFGLAIVRSIAPRNPTRS